MGYIIGYNAIKIKARWYISNFEKPMHNLTRHKSRAFKLDNTEVASAMVKRLKMVRPYDWKAEEISK